MGKDHWPVTSALIIGGDSSGGRVLGGTDNDFLSRPVDMATGEIDSDGRKSPCLRATQINLFKLATGSFSQISIVCLTAIKSSRSNFG